MVESSMHVGIATAASAGLSTASPTIVSQSDNLPALYGVVPSLDKYYDPTRVFLNSPLVQHVIGLGEKAKSRGVAPIVTVCDPEQLLTRSSKLALNREAERRGIKLIHTNPNEQADGRQAIIVKKDLLGRPYIVQRALEFLHLARRERRPATLESFYHGLYQVDTNSDNVMSHTSIDWNPIPHRATKCSTVRTGGSNAFSTAYDTDELVVYKVRLDRKPCYFCVLKRKGSDTSLYLTEKIPSGGKILYNAYLRYFVEQEEDSGLDVLNIGYIEVAPLFRAKGLCKLLYHAAWELSGRPKRIYTHQIVTKNPVHKIITYSNAYPNLANDVRLRSFYEDITSRTITVIHAIWRKTHMEEAIQLDLEVKIE